MLPSERLDVHLDSFTQKRLCTVEVALPSFDYLSTLRVAFTTYKFPQHDCEVIKNNPGLRMTDT